MLDRCWIDGAGGDVASEAGAFDLGPGMLIWGGLLKASKYPPFVAPSIGWLLLPRPGTFHGDSSSGPRVALQAGKSSVAWEAADRRCVTSAHTTLLTSISLQAPNWCRSLSIKVSSSTGPSAWPDEAAAQSTPDSSRGRIKWQCFRARASSFRCKEARHCCSCGLMDGMWRPFRS